MKYTCKKIQDVVEGYFVKEDLFNDLVFTYYNAWLQCNVQIDAVKQFASSLFSEEGTRKKLKEKGL